jgi:hypothetical protein
MKLTREKQNKFISSKDKEAFRNEESNTQKNTVHFYA